MNNTDVTKKDFEAIENFISNKIYEFAPKYFDELKIKNIKATRKGVLLSMYVYSADAEDEYDIQDFCADIGTVVSNKASYVSVPGTDKKFDFELVYNDHSGFDFEEVENGQYLVELPFSYFSLRQSEYPYNSLKNF